MELSSQAKWYLRGVFPLRDNVHGYASPEPKAIQELVNAGLLKLQVDILGDKYYSLTKEGKEERDKQCRH